MEHLIYVLFIGIVAGWLSGKIMKGRGFGLLGNLIVGIIGSAIGGVIFNAIGLSAIGTIGEIICSTVGALALLFALRLISGN